MVSSRPAVRTLALAATAVAAFLLSGNNRAFPITMGDPLAVEGAFGVGWLAGLLFGRWGVLAVVLGAAGSAAWADLPAGTAACSVLAVAVEGLAGWLVMRSGPLARGVNRLEEVAAVIVSGTAAALGRGAAVALAAKFLGLPDPLWQGAVAAGVSWFSNVLAATVGAVWLGEWRVRFQVGRTAELAALLALIGFTGNEVFGGARPMGLDLPFPLVAWLAVLHAWAVIRFHSQGLSLATLVWFVLFDAHAARRGTFDPIIPLSAAPAYQVLLFLGVGVLNAVELAVAAVAAHRAAEAADNARLADELRARNEQLEARATEAARENAFLDAVLAQLPAGVMIVSPDGKILRRNERHEQLWRLQGGAEQLNQLGSGAFAESNNRRVPFENWPIVRAILHGETTDGFEAKLASAGGDVRVSIGAAPVYAAGGALLGAVAVMTDVTEQKATLASLRESELRLRLSLASARMMAYEWDAVTLAFRTAEPLRAWCGLGDGPEPATVGDLEALAHPDDRAALAVAAAAVVAGGTRCEKEFRLLRSDGTAARVMSRSTRLTDADGRLTDRVVGILVDVTDRQRNEDRLRLLESAVVHARDAVVILESEPESGKGRSVLYANAAFCRMTGYAADELTGRSLHFLRGPKSDAATLDQLREALDGGSPFQGELLNYRKDGSEFWVELSVVPVPDRDGRCAHFVMIQRDVSDRKRAEAELRRSEQLLSDAQRIAHIGSWEYDPATAVLHWSVEQYRISGREPGTFVPTAETAIACVHPDDRPTVVARFAATGEERPELLSLEYRLVRPTGEVRYVRDQVAPTFDAAGNVVRLYGVTHDITESRQAQEQLAQAQKMELIGQMAGGIAHDFNNILTAIIGNLARVHLPLADPNAASVGIALSAAGRAADLTRKLLGFARRHQLLLAPVRAAEFVREVVELVHRTFDPRITVRVDLDDELSVSADATLMSQVLLNLCVNAKDAMPDGGTLTLAAGPAVVTDAPPDGHPGRHARITVTDTGTGIPSDVMAHLFEPFFTTKPVGKGTGLGLAMVHGIMKQHDGWVECRSEVGVGTEFALYLPLLATAAASARGTPAVAWASDAVPLTDTPHPSDRAATILLVDDEDMIRDLGRAVLESAGYRVLEASDGEEAVAVFRDRRAGIDLVILDLTMPRMSGRDAFRLLAEADPTVRVLLSSGYTADGLNDTDGILGLLPKPYRPNELLDAVGVALNLTPTPSRAVRF